MTAIALKVLLVHHADQRKSLSQHEVGWGRFKEDPIHLLECEPESATIIFQGKLAKGEYRRCPIPFPNLPFPDTVEIKATICIQAHTDPEYAINYTRSGMGAVFRPRYGIGDEEAAGFFGKRPSTKKRNDNFEMMPTSGKHAFTRFINLRRRWISLIRCLILSITPENGAEAFNLRLHLMLGMP